MTWEDELTTEMLHVEQQNANRAATIARFVAAREHKIAGLWQLIDDVVARVNTRVPPGGRQFRSEESTTPRAKTVIYGERRLRLEVEALRYDTARQEPAFYPDGLARVYVEPSAQDLSEFFCAVSPEGVQWLALPTRQPVTQETVSMLLRALLR